MPSHQRAHPGRRDAPAAAESPGPSGREGRARAARQLGRRSLHGPRTVEAYLRASNPPRYMQRLREMESEFQVQRRRLEAAYRALEDDCGDAPDRFAGRWRARAQTWPFDALNELIREHNEWYPVEANLPMDPRTRDYVAVGDGSYRRIELGADWILEHLPPRPRTAAAAAKLPRRVPREPVQPPRRR